MKRLFKKPTFRQGIMIACLFCGLTATAQTVPNLYKNADQRAMNRWVDSVMQTLSPDEKIGQLFMPIVKPSHDWQTKTLKWIDKQKIGGILFSGGTTDEQLASLQRYQEASRIPLLISADAEWGLSMRLKNTPRFPKNMMLGAIQDNQWLQRYGEEMGRECREMGIHINFAPVLDVNSNPANPVIGTRSFGENPQPVAAKAIAYAQGLESQGVLSVGKHFPGHGDTSQDSHLTLPSLSHNRARLDAVELLPFRQYIAAGLGGMMTAHLAIPALDSTAQLPASLSPSIVTDLLTDELGFQGLKFTDALMMKGATRTGSSACVESLLAGNDVLLGMDNVETEFSAVRQAVASGLISMQKIDEHCRKILTYKYILHNNATPSDKNLSTETASELILKLNAEAITLLKNKKEAIPLQDLERKIAVVSIGDHLKNSFQTTLALYDNFDFIALDSDKAQSFPLPRLSKYDAVIVALHSEKTVAYNTALQSLGKATEVHLCFFTSPYYLSKMKSAIRAATSLVLAYENTDGAQQMAAQVMMGGLPAKGKLPVAIKDLYDCGDGLTTEKAVRLAYLPPSAVGMSSRVLSRIDSVVADGIRQKAFPGCQILVAKDGVVVYHRAFGYFDYDGNHPVSNNDIYDVASLTKVTATLPAIMQLYDHNKLRLSAPLSQYVPLLRNSDKAKITVRNALYHQSGLIPFISFVPDLQVFPTPHTGFNRQAGDSFYIADNFDAVILRRIVESKLKPQRYLYSDLNFMLLKEAVENLSEKSLDVYTEENFYAPLGSATTGFLPMRKFDRSIIAPTEYDTIVRRQLIRGFTHDESAAFMGGVSGNAGLFSNANDLAKLLQMYLNHGVYGGKRYFSAATAKLFTTSKSTISRRGLGFDKPDKAHETGSTALQASAATYGHTGYTGTCFWVDPEQQLIYIFLSNRVYPSRNTGLMTLNIRPKIQAIIYEAISTDIAYSTPLTLTTNH